MGLVVVGFGVSGLLSTVYPVFLAQEGVLFFVQLGFLHGFVFFF